MSVTYRGVHWNRQKRTYDVAMVGGVALGMAAFGGVSVAANPNITTETIILRATSFSALLLLHVVLCIGPLARLDRRFLPLLYNRRHLGVFTFLLALVHAVFATLQFHSFGDAFPLTSVFFAYGGDYAAFVNRISDIAHFPFEPFGVIALVILFLMAATSHDFWLRNLGASWWKALHIGVYVAYGAVLVHVAFGFLQADRGLLYPIMMVVGFVAIAILHLTSFVRERRTDLAIRAAEADGYIHVCGVSDLREGWGHAAMLRYDRVAVYLHEGLVYALSNVCRHQAGPIGEGKVIDGAVTCPWHGWNYRIEDGVSPPPFNEVLPTYRVRVEGDHVFVHPDAHRLEARSTGAPLSGGESEVASSGGLE